MRRSRSHWRVLKALGGPAPAYVADPLRFAVAAAHAEEDAAEEERRRTLDANYAYAVLHNPKEAHRMLAQRWQAAGFPAAVTTTLTTTMRVRLDEYFGPAELPDGIDDRG